ncbi:hypothetical protein P5V15_006845 [Pogonomyrmex californicus]
MFAQGDNVIAYSTVTMILSRFFPLDGGTVNGRGRCSAIKGAARRATLLTPRPDLEFMAGIERKRYMQADRGRGRDRGSDGRGGGGSSGGKDREKERHRRG